MADDTDELDLLKAIRVLALRAVQEKDADYLYRHISRWYSREFHTPLQEVEALPFEDLLEHFFECQYENFNEPERLEEGRSLMETAEEREERSVADAEFAEQILQSAEKLNQTVDSIKKLTPTAPTKPAPIEAIPEGIKIEFADDLDLDNWDVLSEPKKK